MSADARTVVVNAALEPGAVAAASDAAPAWHAA
ncbi:MAG: hypothetical protein JWR63_55, partial [Conexibacter sp.]|nr:hypothetical protein [Conexibacter sp.]